MRELGSFMRVIAHVERSLDGAIVAEPKLFFRPSIRHKRTPAAIKHESFPRIVKQRIDWFVASVWLGAVALGLTWWAVILYGFFRAIRTDW